MCVFFASVFLLLVISSVNTKDIVELQYVEGTEGSMPCSITAPSPEDFTTLVLWYKDGSESPIYGLDNRFSEDGQKPKQFAQDSLGSRAQFQMNAKTPGLRVDPIKYSDQGVYRCRVDFALARTINHFIKLKVIVPPEGVVIKTEDNKVVDKTIGPYLEGDDVTLSCLANGGSPRPEVVWKINGRPINNIILEEKHTKENGEEVIIRKDITLKNLKRRDLNSKVVCQASNNNISKPISTSALISLNLAPTSVKLSTSMLPMLASDATTAQCVSYGGHPQVAFRWYVGDKNLTQFSTVTNSEDKNSTTSSLTFTPSTSDNGKMIYCRSFNPSLRASISEQFQPLSVLFAPIVELKLKSHPDEIWIKEGEYVSLTCEAHSNPGITDIRWFYNSQPLEKVLSVLTGALMERNGLVLQHVSKIYSGNYSCTAENEIGVTSSQNVYVEVKYPPRCKNGVQEVYRVGVFKTKEVVCEVDSLPPHVTFQWYFMNDKQKYELGDIKNFPGNLTSTAAFVPTGVNDYGKLYCIASNSIGKQEEPCVFTIVQTDPPEQLKNCTINNVTENSLQVDCIPGYNGGLKQVFLLEVYSKWTHALQENLTSVERPSFTISNLPADTEYVIVAYSANSLGRSVQTAVIVQTAPVQPGSYKLSSNTIRNATKHQVVGSKKISMSIAPVLSILVGIVATVMVFVIIILIMVRMISRKKLVSQLRVQSNELNGEINEERYCEQKAVDPLLQVHEKSDISEGSVYDANANKKRLNNELNTSNLKKVQNYDDDIKKNEEDVTYAELCFPPNFEPRKINSKESPTEYAKIIVKKTSPPSDDNLDQISEINGNSETPLICIHIESSV